MKENRKAKLIAGLFIFFIILILVADYYNVPSRLGFVISNCNLDVQSIIISNGIVILLFILAFVLFDKRGVEKEKNKRLIALTILKNVYTHCKESSQRFAQCENGKFLLELFKIDFSDIQDPTMAYYRSFPFLDVNETIIAFAQEGVLNASEIEVYLNIRKQFASYVECSLGLAELKGADKIFSRKLGELIENIDKALNLIDKELLYADK